MASRNHAERPLRHRAVVEIRSDRQRRVVGVRPERDVVVPLHLLAALAPLEVQLRVVELHVGADEVGHGVGQHRVIHVLPEHRMVLGRIAHPTQPGRARAVIGLEVEGVVGAGDLAAALDQLLGGVAELPDPLVADDPFEEEVALLEVELALRLRQHPRRDGKDLFWRHGGLAFSVPSCRGCQARNSCLSVPWYSALTCRPTDSACAASAAASRSARGLGSASKWPYLSVPRTSIAASRTLVWRT